MRKATAFIIGIILGAFLIVMANQFYRLRGKEEVAEELKIELGRLGQKAIETKDVPVAAIVTYFDTIIGVGYNTVKRDFNISGHAEINALSDAYHHFGDEFSKLDRSQLILYTTFEPCEMCKGAIVNNRIQKVYFELNKGFIDQSKLGLKQLLYELKKKRFNALNLQENLFLQHPDYPGKK